MSHVPTFSSSKEPIIATLTDATASAERILRTSFDRYAGRIALACSFGGPSGMVLLDLALRIEPRVPVYYLDTGLLFPETYALVERASRRYGIEPIAVKPEQSPEQQAERYGAALWGRDPDRCCALRKVEPQEIFLRGYEAWLSGVRRAQSSTRANLEPFANDERSAAVKVSPLYDWSDDDVAAYVDAHAVPLNALHAAGYPSIGCMPCTRAVAPGEDSRAGRWSGFEKTECGLHLPAQGGA